MYIANPIYDTVFKHLMENDKVARFFIETLIETPVESIEVVPSEFTYFVPKDKKTANLKTGENSDNRDFLGILRYDFLAIINTKEGHKKVLIEIQKAKNNTDIMRFRQYLAEQYKRKNVIKAENKKTKEVLPIITIYMLGFKLPETKAIAIAVSRHYRDMIDSKELNIKSKFIECLTHDSYVVQIPRIEGKTRTRLEKLLSIFEQEYFFDERGILKEYNHKLDDENIRYMVDILHHTGADPKQQVEIEKEWEAYQYLEEFEEQIEAIAELKQAISKHEKTIEEKDKSLAEKDDLIKKLQTELKLKNNS